MRVLVAAMVLALVTGCASPVEPANGQAEQCAPSLATAPTEGGGLELPSDVAVGRGVLIYRPCTGCAARLVTGNGVYTLPPLAGPPPAHPEKEPDPETLDPMAGIRLSPGGRWLARPVVDGVVLRDLTTTAEVPLPGVQLYWSAWSDDDRWLTTTTPSGDLLLHDLVSGTSRPVLRDAAHAGWLAAAVFAPDQVLLRTPPPGERNDPSSQRPTFVVVDPGTGEVRREYPMDFGSATVGMVRGRIIPSITAIDDLRDEVVIADIEAGGVIGRHPLPAPEGDVEPFWAAYRVAGDGVVLVNRPYHRNPPAPSPTDPGQLPMSQPVWADPVEVFQLDLTSGQRQLTCRLPGWSEVVMPG